MRKISACNMEKVSFLERTQIKKRFFIKSASVKISDSIQKKIEALSDLIFSDLMNDLCTDPKFHKILLKNQENDEFLESGEEESQEGEEIVHNFYRPVFKE